MTSASIGSFQVSQEDSCLFSKASGDFNPLHIDPVIARRYQFGSTVIHGVCGFFKAIDLLLDHYKQSQSLVSVKAQFIKPVRHDDKVDVVSKVSANGVKLVLLVAGKKAQIVDLVFAKGLVPEPVVAEKKVDQSLSVPKPIELTFSEATSLDKAFDLIWDPDLFQVMFPNVKCFLPDCQSAVLLGLTNIVGMQCPGIDSIFASFSIDFTHGEFAFDPTLHFKVTKSDSRFSLITIGVFHNTAKGCIDALFRPKFIRQPKYLDIVSMTPTNVFASQKALVIGGSRGAGEVTAKLIAAGGGQVVITYAYGKSDAEKVVDDIKTNGGACDVLPYNVLLPSAQITDCFNGEDVSHVYYFASPLIEKSNQPVWDDVIFQKFYNVYMLGLVKLMELFLPVSNYRRRGMTIFIPSTIFLSEPQQGFGEYVASKAVVEAFARQFSAKHDAWRFVMPRLPRMLTDQTSGVVTGKPLATAEIMLEVLIDVVNQDNLK